MDVCCLSDSSCLDPPSLSLYFLFLFYIHLLSGRICLVSSGVNPRYPLIYAAVSSLQLPVSMSLFPKPSLSMFAAVDLRWLIYRPASPPSGWVIDPFHSSLLILFVYTTKSQTFPASLVLLFLLALSSSSRCDQHSSILSPFNVR